LERGDVKTAYATLPDQLEYRLAATWPEARVLRSRDEVIDFFKTFQETFPDASTASHEYLEGDHGNRGRRVSGRWVGANVGCGRRDGDLQVWEILDQDNLTVTRVTEFTNRREALEAAGLSG
jgi:hypothetical protein